MKNLPKAKALEKAKKSYKKSYSGHYQMDAGGKVRQLSQKTSERKGMSSN